MGGRGELANVKQKLKRKMSQFQKASKLQSLEVDLVEVLLQIYLMKNLKLEYLKKEVTEMEKLIMKHLVTITFMTLMEYSKPEDTRFYF